MFFLNLTAGEFSALLGLLGGFITALYLLDRTKRKKVVSTLRFWVPGLSAEQRHSRKRMAEPWSLALQLVSLLLVLLAIAQLQWGTRERRGRDHVLLLDTSSWAGAKVSDGIAVDLEKRAAEQYLERLAAQDRVMLVRVDGLATPVTSFTSDRAQLLRALRESGAGYSALNIEQALSFARQAQSWSGGEQGEIVYIGPKLVSNSDVASQPIPNLRTISVPFKRENCGIRRIGVRRSDEDAKLWQATITLKNYGLQLHTVHLRAQFAGTTFTSRVFRLKPGEESGAEYNFSTDAAGQLVAEITPTDDLSSDNRAAVELPRSGLLRLAAYTNRPDVLRPLLEANHRLKVKFFSPAEYAIRPPADVMLLDQMTAARPPQMPSLWIEPPKEASPLPIKTVVNGAVIKSWNQDAALAAGLHAKAAGIPVAEVFQTFEADVPVGSISEGPTVVARPATEGRPKLAVIGFDPFRGQLRFEVTTPLLFANLLRWLSPESFRTVDAVAGRVGAATVTLDPSERADRIRVTDERGFAMPFTVRAQSLQVFASYPSIVHVSSDDRERVLSLTLPDVAEFEWKPAANSASGLPVPARFRPGAKDLWQWLALLGGVGWFIEWMLYGGRQVPIWRKPAPRRNGRPTPERERELVGK
jgi:von Willebrand factor type A domain/Aerotolerance regulator N-terminal